MAGVDHPQLVHLKIKRMVGVLGIVRVAGLSLRPVNDLAHVLDEGLALSQVLRGVHAFAVHTRATDLDSACGAGN